MTTPPDAAATVTRAKALIDDGDLPGAIKALSEVATADSSGESEGLLGLALYRVEDYAGAVEHLQAALSQQPAREDWQELIERARHNAEAEVSHHVIEIHHFDRETLLGDPVVAANALPSPPQRQGLSLHQAARTLLGKTVGEVVTYVMEATTEVVGQVFGYRDAVWTNWSRRNTALGILTLAYMRNQLNRLNLIGTYPASKLVGFVEAETLTPPPGATHFRTADGTWNNFGNPKEGAANTRFPRNVRAAAVKPETGDRLMTPNPRLVSRVLLERGETMPEVPFLNMLAAAWINFQNHDWISHGENITTALHEIPLAEDDPARVAYRQKYLFVAKTQPDPTRQEWGESMPVTFINEVTHWWDGSQIYGSDQATVDRLRSHVDGKIRLTPDGLLPLDSHGVEDTGFRRNWWLGLSMYHTLFDREHNAICDMLKRNHPDWDDNRLFNVARLINAAVMAKIHSVEWTPAILPNQVLSDGLNANWYGLLTNLFRRGRGKKTVAPINIRNPEMGGVVGNPMDKHGQAYGLTQEFVEVYRLHSLLPEKLTIRRAGADAIDEEIPFVRARQAGSAKINRRVAMSDLFYSFGKQQPGQLILNNYPRFMTELSVPGNPVFDMGAVDILRARERGVPRYNEFRRQLGLNPIRRFEDLTNDKEQLGRLRSVYGDDVEQLDLLVGTLGEQAPENRPVGFGFGETLFQIFILNATRRLQADRFYTDCYNEETYTKEGLDWVDAASLKTVILRHYPELATTGLGNVKNAFEPWDSEPVLSKERHPLRWYDRELRGQDPSRGDAG